MVLEFFAPRELTFREEKKEKDLETQIKAVIK